MESIWCLSQTQTLLMMSAFKINNGGDSQNNQCEPWRTNRRHYSGYIRLHAQTMEIMMHMGRAELQRWRGITQYYTCLTCIFVNMLLCQCWHLAWSHDLALSWQGTLVSLGIIRAGSQRNVLVPVKSVRGNLWYEQEINLRKMKYQSSTSHPQCADVLCRESQSHLC